MVGDQRDYFYPHRLTSRGRRIRIFLEIDLFPLLHTHLRTNSRRGFRPLVQRLCRPPLRQTQQRNFRPRSTFVAQLSRRGWGLYVFGVMVCSVCTTAYILDCYPNAAGEVMAYMNFARVMVGRPRFVRWGADFRVGFRLGIISPSGVRSRDLMCRLCFKRWLWRLRLRSWC
jgi:hypothetical protein